ncbi:unnamed protein product [Ilex paraguariensis]|uniref:BZIP domain-containing protein n=1 Tax=Ilex paraguariensis TaxID=185542 RepID=A0ABC8SPE0_9AQUA
MMGSYMNFKNFGDTPQAEGSGGKPAGNFSLARQSSIYSLTFDELQNTLGGHGKDFGSMNMEDLLKNIWTAEETQVMASSTVGGEGGIPGGNLQRQGSLTLPRTLSQKTVDEVWRDLLYESGSVKDGSGSGIPHLTQREPTLGEITLEEFLLRAGVVKEDIQPIARPNNAGFYGEMSGLNNNNNTGFFLGFQEPVRNHGVLANQIGENNNVVQNPSPNIGLNVGGVRTSQQQLQSQPNQHPQPLFPKQQTVAFASPMHLNNQLPSPGTRSPIVARADPSMNTALVQGGVIQSGAMGMSGMVTGVKTIAGGSPANQLSPEVIAKRNLVASSLLPSPYAFSEGLRGRKSSNNFEKVVERRRRRMIKNRESAARSRARKQAYTVELEEEIAKLKEINQELQKKQEEYAEKRKNQIKEKMIIPWGGKQRGLRRTFTGPW